ncbi:MULTISPECIES: MFS transporter [Marichromatium]|uniref:YNFM family putative membrane transporter n=1 Tax=Marichromatium gracile TaxID=1048 RepID=A0A4R4AH97_MARGR|nr:MULTISPECIES: MFS transporter [Marichromatium]MBO8085798.1 MFS transporter [Marichromatium sp.]MBK1708377.1 MFS transporter [Marichromatium gracile]RNE88312.1 MFS transporter [Marichromatium sp. AB32]RNE89523.1 MFS transporter [Marichromatium sp. AB31]TCW38495.1 YNFM family putative membrane transporter [Marichromatium gracile]
MSPPITARTPAFWRATLALCLGSIAIFANLYAPQPLLPLLRGDLGISELQASLTLSVTTFTLGLSLLLFGPLSDAIGRRAIMFTTLALATACALALAFAPDFGTLLALRALQGFFLGGVPALALAYLGDEFDHEALLLAVGIYIGGNSIGGIAGRLLSGASAAEWGWQASFLSAGLLSLAVLIAFIILLPPSRRFQPKPPRPRAMVADLALHLRNPSILGAYLIGGLNFMVFINLYSYVTFLLSAPPYHLSPMWLGMLFLTYLSGTVAASFSGRLARGRSQPLAMAAGTLLLLGGTLLTLVPHLAAIIGGLLVNAVGFFFAHSQAASWVSHKATRARASASSLYLVFYYTGASLGGFYLGPYWHWADWPGVVLGAVLILIITLGLALWLHAREHGHEHACPWWQRLAGACREPALPAETSGR